MGFQNLKRLKYESLDDLNFHLLLRIDHIPCYRSRSMDSNNDLKFPSPNRGLFFAGCTQNHLTPLDCRKGH